MSEETTEETPTPDETTFDITGWLSKGNAGRAKETVTVYNDLGLFDEARKVASEIELHNAQVEAQGEDLAVGEKSHSTELEERQAEIQDRINAAKGEVVITSLSPSEAEALVADYKEAFGEKADIDGELRGKFWRLSKAATFNGAKLTPDQWQAVSENIAGGQWAEVDQKMLLAQGKRPQVTNPFLRGGSRLPKAAMPG